MGQGIGILVTKFPKETSASYSLREPAEVYTIVHYIYVYMHVYGMYNSCMPIFVQSFYAF